jgi:hypothetical protein
MTRWCEVEGEIKAVRVYNYGSKKQDILAEH